MEKQKGSDLLNYLQSQDDNEAKNKLSFYNNLHNSTTDPIGRLVHSLVMMRLLKKANEAEKINRIKRAQLFDEYNQKRFNEKKMLEELKFELEKQKEKRELAKEDRAERRKDRRDNISHQRDLEKEVIKEEMQLALNKQKGIQKAIEKSFAPGSTDQLEYMLNPEEAEKRRETYDSRGALQKYKGKTLRKLRIGKNTPKMQSRLKHE